MRNQSFFVINHLNFTADSHLTLFELTFLQFFLERDDHCKYFSGNAKDL